MNENVEMSGNLHIYQRVDALAVGKHLQFSLTSYDYLSGTSELAELFWIDFDENDSSHRALLRKMQYPFRIKPIELADHVARKLMIL